MRLSIPFLSIIILLGIGVQANCAEQFKDVPKDHWAAEYVAKAASDGIMKGYPDSTFKGDNAVTRYELAVALERMIEVVEKGLKPEVDRQKAESGERRAEGKVTSSPQPSPPGEGVESPKWKVESRDAAVRLKAGGYIAADSPLLTNREKPVSTTELAQALSSVTAKLIEKHVPPPKDLE